MRAEAPLGRRLLQPILRGLVWLFMRVQVRGLERVPDSGSGIIFYNHIHWLDPPLVCATSRRYVVPLTKIEASRFPVVGSLLRWYHVVFISRGSVDRAALRATWDLMREGGVSVISPEGTRSHDGCLQSAKEGLAFIARQVPEAWLIPCAVTGTPAFSFGFPHILRRPRITLTYGRPFRFCWPAGSASREMMRDMTDDAMAQLAACLPPPMRGYYAAAPEPKHLEFLAG